MAIQFSPSVSHVTFFVGHQVQPSLPERSNFFPGSRYHDLLMRSSSQGFEGSNAGLRTFRRGESQKHQREAVYYQDYTLHSRFYRVWTLKSLDLFGFAPKGPIRPELGAGTRL